MVIDSTALVSFILSPRGFSALLISATIFLTVRFIENAGLSYLVVGQTMGKNPTPLSAFKHVFARFHSLLGATISIIISVLALIIPLSLVAGYFAHRLLSQHDINYYLHAKP